MATLLFTNHIWVRVFVPEPWLGHIAVGDTVKVRVDSFPGKDFAGTVEQIAREAEFTPRNVQTVEERVNQVFGVKVRLDNSSNDLRAGTGDATSGKVLFTKHCGVCHKLFGEGGAVGPDITNRQRRPATQRTVVEFNGPGNNGTEIRNGVAVQLKAIWDQ